MRGHVDLAAPEALKFKEGDGPAFAFHAHTTDKLLLAAENGRFYTLAADRLPGGRGFGEPVRATIDLDGSVGIVALLRAAKIERLLVAASDGRGGGGGGGGGWGAPAATCWLRRARARPWSRRAPARR